MCSSLVLHTQVEDLGSILMRRKSQSLQLVLEVKPQDLEKELMCLTLISKFKPQL